MPNRETHIPVALMAGGTAAFICAPDGDDSAKVLETIGGLAGAYVGGRLPDMIDLPNSPNHRSIGHGIGSAGTSLCLLAERIPEIQNYFRTKATEFKSKAITDDPWKQVSNELFAVLCLLASGAVVGLAAGYASHLALDAGTKAGLPLFS